MLHCTTWPACGYAAQFYPRCSGRTVLVLGTPGGLEEANRQWPPRVDRRRGV